MVLLSIESEAQMTLDTEFGVISNSNRRSPEISDTSQSFQKSSIHPKWAADKTFRLMSPAHFRRMEDFCKLWEVSEISGERRLELEITPNFVPSVACSFSLEDVSLLISLILWRPLWPLKMCRWWRQLDEFVPAVMDTSLDVWCSVVLLLFFVLLKCPAFGCLSHRLVWFFPHTRTGASPP